ncbi:MAG: hypothetical protein ACOCP4_00750 [Candidatus Woesearchaeota archaeon]
MRNDIFEDSIKKRITFERDDVTQAFINAAYFLRKYEIPDEKIIDILTTLYYKARNDVERNLNIK